MKIQELIWEQNQDNVNTQQVADLEKRKEADIRKELIKKARKGEKVSAVDFDTIERQRDLEKKMFTKSTDVKRAEDKLARDRKNAIEKLKRGAFNLLTKEEKDSIALRMGVVPQKLDVDDVFGDRIPKEVKNTDYYETIKLAEKDLGLMTKDKITKMLNDCAKTNNIPVFAITQIRFKEDPDTDEWQTIELGEGEFLVNNFNKLMAKCISEKFKDNVVEELKIRLQNLGINAIKKIPVINLVTKLFPETFSKKFKKTYQYEKYPYPPIVVKLPFRNENGNVISKEYLAPPGATKYAAKSKDGTPLKSSSGEFVPAYKRDSIGNPLTQDEPFDNIQYKSERHKNLEFFIPDSSGRKLVDEEQTKYIMADRTRRVEQFIKSYNKNDYTRVYPLITEDTEIVKMTISPYLTRGVEAARVSQRIEENILFKKEPDGDLYVIDPKTKKEISVAIFPEERTAIKANKNYKLEIPQKERVFESYPKLKRFQTVKQSRVARTDPSSVFVVEIRDFTVEDSYNVRIYNPNINFTNPESFVRHVYHYTSPQYNIKDDSAEFTDSVKFISDIYGFIRNLCESAKVLDNINQINTERVIRKITKDEDIVDKLGKSFLSRSFGKNYPNNITNKLINKTIRNTELGGVLNIQTTQRIERRIYEQSELIKGLLTDDGLTLQSIFVTPVDSQTNPGNEIDYQLTKIGETLNRLASEDERVLDIMYKIAFIYLNDYLFEDIMNISFFS